MGLDDANLSRTLDEAFGRGPPPRSKSRGNNNNNNNRHNNPRARSPDKSVGSHGSQERRSGAGGRGGGIPRQRSNRRASIAAAVHAMAGADNHHKDSAALEEHAQQRRARRKTHEDRLQAASMDGIAGGVINPNLGYGGRDRDGMGDESHSDRQDRGGHRGGGARQQQQHYRQDLGYEDADVDYYDQDDQDDDYEEEEVHHSNNRRSRGGAHGGARRPRRQSNDDDRYYEEEQQQPRRGTRMPSRNASKSFDIADVRARGRRRASILGGSSAAAGDDESNSGTSTGLRAARRVRRASMIQGDQAGNLKQQEPPPPSRGVPESRSGRRTRRTQSMVEGVAYNPAGPGLRRTGTRESAGGGSSSVDHMGGSNTGVSLRRGGGGAAAREAASREDLGYGDLDDNTHDGGGGDVDQEKQEWQEKRSEKQRAMLERLRGANIAADEAAGADEGSLEDGFKPEEEPEPEPEVEKPKARRKTMSITKKFGMSSTNFASFEEDEVSRKSSGRRKASTDKSSKPEARKSTPARHKSSEGVAGSGGRARAADTDRRRRGTMLDRIGG